MHRLRAALGVDVVRHERGIYHLDPDLDVWCDADEFTKLVERARTLAVRDARTEDLWRRALALHNGEYLANIAGEWPAARRKALRDTFVEALVGAAECARARGDPQEALTSFKRALEVEPYREDIHRNVMRCYAARGSRQKVLAYFKALQAAFREELDADLSEETVCLVNSLLDSAG